MTVNHSTLRWSVALLLAFGLVIGGTIHDVLAEEGDEGEGDKKKTPPPPPTDFSDIPVPLEKGHLDLRWVYRNGEWDVHLAFDGIGAFLPDEAVDDYIPLLPGDGVLVLEDKEFPHGSRNTRPAGPKWDFLGVGEKETFWFLPQSFWNCLWPGFAVVGPFAEYRESDQRVGQAVDAWVSFYLRDIRYVGAAVQPEFSTWTNSSVSGLSVWMSSKDGIDDNDRFIVGKGGHAHLAWGFSSRGIYEIDLEATAFLGPGASNETSTGTQTFTFAVGSFAQWQAQFFNNKELIDPSISGPNADPDGDRISNLLEYAFRLYPDEHSSEVFLEDTKSGLPIIQLRRTSGQPEGYTVEYPRRRTNIDSAPDPQIRYLVEVSSDLNEWNEYPGAIETAVPIDTMWEHVTTKLNFHQSDSGSLYVRVRVELIP